MLLINNNSVEPYFNQALEEFLLNNFEEDIVMVWQNENAIVVGKHQNSLAEINFEIVNLYQTKVVRRLSGGGTVFHDLGNINFTFIKKYTGNSPGIDFKKFLTPIVQFLKNIGVDAEFSGRNDILVNGKKISGNAEHIFHRHKKILHHGTLLFNSNLEVLKKTLRDNSDNYTDKAVKSVRSSVYNISSHLKEQITTEDFIYKLRKYIIDIYSDITIYELSDKDKKSIQQLVDEKYGQWKWNFGYSPKYTFKKSTSTQLGNLEVLIYVENGLIKKTEINSSFIDNKDIENLTNYLIGQEHKQEVIIEKIKNIIDNEYLKKISEDELVNAFF